MNRAMVQHVGKRVMVMASLVSTLSCAAPVRAVAAHMTTVDDARPASTFAAEPVMAVEAPATSRKTHLRRMLKREIGPALLAEARVIIDRYGNRPYGSEIAFEIDGTPYVAIIERHYHPEGGPTKPWGYHPGCSLFAVEIDS